MKNMSGARKKSNRDYWFHDSISWLKVSDDIREGELTALCETRHEGTCEWVFRNSLFQTWKYGTVGEPILWIKGVLGAGNVIQS